MSDTAIQLLLCGALLTVLYPYALYPFCLRMLRRRQNEWQQAAYRPDGVSIVVAARNEADRLQRRVEEILHHLRTAGLDGEVIVVSDGSTDGTVPLLRRIGDPNLVIIELPQNEGKAVALNHGVRQARFSIVVFSDVRQTWDDALLPRLLENFADPAVGAVSGDLVLKQPDGALAGVGLYWRLEKWIREQEAQLASCVGVTGAVAAVRRQLYRDIPAGTILDDVCWPLHVAMQGYRVVHDRRARSYDVLPARPRDEFRRKVRTLCGNFQLVLLMPGLLHPVKNPLFFYFVSHKLLRLAVPWALLTLLITTALLPGAAFGGLFLLQLAGYGTALLGLVWPPATRLPLVSAASSFLLLNAACACAWLVWLGGRSQQSWRAVSYAPATRA